jgi:hypothetical protein
MVRYGRTRVQLHTRYIPRYQVHNGVQLCLFIHSGVRYLGTAVLGYSCTRYSTKFITKISTKFSSLHVLH